MADKNRFAYFAHFIVEHFKAGIIFDIAGGKGSLNKELSLLQKQVTTFDTRYNRLDVRYAAREFTLTEPCECDLVVGMHPDGATRIILEYAGRYRIPFAIVPCCSDNSLPYRSWVKHLVALAKNLNLECRQHPLPMAGRNLVLYGFPPEKEPLGQE
jgi:hypothetical protein